MSDLGPPQSLRRPAGHQRWVALLVAIFLLGEVSLVVSNVRGLGEPSAGFVYHQHPTGEIEPHPVTEPALEAFHGVKAAVVVEVNGTALATPERGVAALQRYLDVRMGARNRFKIRTPRDGREREIELPVAAASLKYLTRGSPEVLLFPLVGLLYLALGLWVWWKRPRERSSIPMLLFSLVAASLMHMNLGFDAWAGAYAAFERAAFPAYAPSLLFFALNFTGYHGSRRLRWVLGVTVAAALSLAAYESFFAWPDPARFELARELTGGLLAGSVLVVTGVGLLAARRRNPLALRRRGKLLAKASFLAFFVPSLTLILPDFPGRGMTVVTLLAIFPAAIAFSVVRHGVFDLRVVLRQGLLYALLSIGVLLGYLALALVAVHVAGESEHAHTFAAVAVVVMVLSLLQLRVQGAINRFVFRSRYLFNEAIAQASAKLARAKSTAAVTDAVRTALIGKLELSRATLAMAARDGQVLQCIPLGDDGSTLGEGDAPPAPLPATLVVARLTPLRRALASQDIVTAYDSAAATAQVAFHRGGSSNSGRTDTQWAHAPRCDEGTFWTQFGLEAIVPLTVGTDEHDGSRVVGALLLGPKRNGKPLDSADEHLVFTLANQLAVALENAAAFEEIRSLKDGLEQQVEQRTHDLRSALDELEQAQLQLVESEKQAMLGRLVAGMAHEINTPLGTLRSSVDTLRRVLRGYRELADGNGGSDGALARRLTRSSGSVDKLLDVVDSSTQRLGGMVGSLKRFVSLDQSARQRLDVRECIDSALAVLAASLTPDITIKQSYSDPDLSILGDPAKINQLFWNLLQNAVTALDGKGEIRIDGRRVNGSVHVDLTDNGVGIPDDRIKDVFNFGFTKKNGRVGLRLGLPTSKLTVEQLGGDIRINSVPGQGTSVHLSLPA